MVVRRYFGARGDRFLVVWQIKWLLSCNQDSFIFCVSFCSVETQIYCCLVRYHKKITQYESRHWYKLRLSIDYNWTVIVAHIYILNIYFGMETCIYCHPNTYISKPAVQCGCGGVFVKQYSSITIFNLSIKTWYVISKLVYYEHCLNWHKIKTKWNTKILAPAC